MKKKETIKEMVRRIIKEEIKRNQLSETIYQHPDAIRGYVEAALWTEYDDNDDNLDENYSINDIDRTSLQKAKEDINKFATLLEKSKLLEPYLDLMGNGGWHDLGHDFWLTRNSHGSGFWDRPELDDNGLGEEITKICKQFTSVSLIVGDDGNLYFE